MLRRDLYVALVVGAGLGWPTVDAFASPTAHQTLFLWDRSCDAYEHDWSKFGLLWVNPPFSMFHRVVDRLARDPCWALVLYPDWGMAWQQRLDAATMTLPDIPLFSRPPCPDLLPTPPWRVRFCVLLPCGGLGLRGYWHDVTCDGDVESNPGPPTVGFLEFATSYANLFLAATDKTAYARTLIDLRHRCSSWPADWLQALFCTATLPA